MGENVYVHQLWEKNALFQSCFSLSTEWKDSQDPYEEYDLVNKVEWKNLTYICIIYYWNVKITNCFFYCFFKIHIIFFSKY